MRHFGSMKRLRAASVDEIAQVRGIPADVAQAVYDTLRAWGKTSKARGISPPHVSAVAFCGTLLYWSIVGINRERSYARERDDITAQELADRATGHCDYHRHGRVWPHAGDACL